MFFNSLPVEKFSQLLIGFIEQVPDKNQRGRVLYGGTSWFAECYTPALEIPFIVGEPVQICARKGNTLLILPDVQKLLNV